MLAGILQVRDLPDPVGVTTLARRLDTGLELFRVTSPIGVLLVIFEARPEVIANIASLALKSGNAVILKGGKESAQTFAAMAKAIQSALETTKVPKGAVQLVESREEVSGLLAMDRWIDLVIPRGGNELVRYIKENTRIPVMGHADGLCAVYVHADADAQKAVSVVVDAKTNYPAACNAAETLLLHKDVVTSGLWWEITGALVKEGVTLKCDERSKASLVGHGLGDRIVEATEKDYDTEFLDLVMAVKVVDNVDEAIEHINLHSSGHTDAILTENEEVAEGFMKRVDSAGVYWNASTRFADGFRYGFGTEVRLGVKGAVGFRVMD